MARRKLDIEAARLGSQRGELTIPALVAERGIKRVDPQGKRRLQCGGVFTEFVIGTEPQLLRCRVTRIMFYQIRIARA
jgi:hypothetical protein